MATNNSYSTVIGADITIKADSVDGDNMRVQGTIIAPVTMTSKLLVDDTGRIEGKIVSPDVVISGKVLGNIVANTIHLMNTAEVVGDITCYNIVSEKGCSLNGVLVMRSEKEAVDKQAETD